MRSGHALQGELLPKAYEARVRRRMISKWTRGTGHTTMGFQVATRHRSQGKWVKNGNKVHVSVRMVSEWRRDISYKHISFSKGYEVGHRTSCFQICMRHTSQDELFPNDYEVLVRGRSRVQATLRHGSEDDLFPKVYEAPVRRRVIS